MTERPRWAPDEVDLDRPSVARVYDYYLGGSHNFESDREFADRVLAVLPQMRQVAQENRAFLRRLVRHLCASGIDQFIDLGSGIPTVGNVHEVASAAAPGARVLYVDNDPVAVTHSREILRGVPDAYAVDGDLTDPAGLLTDPELTSRIDFDRPVGVLFISVLHFVGDELDPAGIVGAFAERVAPGSFVAISHASADGQDGAAAAESVYGSARSPGSMRMRTRAEVEALFRGVEVVDPGVVRIPLWRPDPGDTPLVGADRYPGYAGVAIRR